MKGLLCALLAILNVAIIQANESEIWTAELTGYCPCQKCCSWHYNENGDPVFDLRPNVRKKIGQTASMEMAQANWTLAMPKAFDYGTHVWAGDRLLGVCEDRGGAIKMKGNIVCIDVYFDTHKEALEFGRKKVKVLIKRSE